ncbi:MAG: uroporphyrinogen-III synthase [Gemmatimonadota bacterium]
MAGEHLRGIGVAVTRAPGEAGRLARLLRARGAHVEHWPCIGFEDAEDIRAVQDAVSRFETFDWIAVTSARAATRLAAVADGVPCGNRLAAAGPATAASLAAVGWPVHRVADVPGARGLVDEFARAGDAPGARILFACGDRALSTLSEGLEALGAVVERLEVYRTRELTPEPGVLREAAESGAIRVVTFASPSAVSGFLVAAEVDGLDAAESFGAAALGSTTADFLGSRGWTPVTAHESTMEGLVEAAGVAAVQMSGTGSRGR